MTKGKGSDEPYRWNITLNEIGGGYTELKQYLVICGTFRFRADKLMTNFKGGLLINK